MSDLRPHSHSVLDERWLQPGGIVPVDIFATGALVAEILRLREEIRSNICAASAFRGWPYGMSLHDFCEAVSEIPAPAQSGPAEHAALNRAAYALFQLKRFVDMPQHAIDFCRDEHAAACRVLDGDAAPQPEAGNRSDK